MLWEHLRELRERKGLTQDAVAEHIGVSRSHVSNVERGAVGLSLPMLESYLSAVGAQLVIDVGEYSEISAMVARLPPDRRTLALQLLEVLEVIPDTDLELLGAQVRHWRGRYRSPADG